MENSKRSALGQTVIATILSTILSTGLITAFISSFMQHRYDMELRAHERKVERYMLLIDELSKLTAQQPEWDKLRPQVNAALCYGSDEVASELLAVINEIGVLHRSGRSDLQTEKLKPLILAIRNDLYLKSTRFAVTPLQFLIRTQREAAKREVAAERKREE